MNAESGDRSGWRGWLTRCRRFPADWWFFGSAPVVLLALGAWRKDLALSTLALVPLALPAVTYGQQSWQRSRDRRRHATTAGSLGGTWRGWLVSDTTEWLLPDQRWFAVLLDTAPTPVRLIADAAGITVTVRGPVVSRSWRRPSIVIPWSEVVGARQHERGHKFEGPRLWITTLTEVTVDVVGASAEEWRDRYDEDFVDGAEDTDDGEVGWIELRRDAGGVDWRPGTAPLRFVSDAVDGLVELIERHASGRPWGQ